MYSQVIIWARTVLRCWLRRCILHVSDFFFLKQFFLFSLCLGWFLRTYFWDSILLCLPIVSCSSFPQLLPFHRIQGKAYSSYDNEQLKKERKSANLEMSNSWVHMNFMGISLLFYITELCFSWNEIISATGSPCQSVIALFPKRQKKTWEHYITGLQDCFIIFVIFWCCACFKRISLYWLFLVVSFTHCSIMEISRGSSYPCSFSTSLCFYTLTKQHSIITMFKIKNEHERKKDKKS